MKKPLFRKSVLVLNIILSIPVLLLSLFLIAGKARSTAKSYQVEWAIIDGWLTPSFRWIIALFAAAIVGSLLYSRIVAQRSRSSVNSVGFRFYLSCIWQGILFGSLYGIILSSAEITSAVLSDVVAGKEIVITAVPLSLIPYLISAALLQNGIFAVLLGGTIMGLANGLLIHRQSTISNSHTREQI